MSEPQSKRKKHNYYMQKKRKQYILEPGLRGFICTCNFREKECVREAYNILNLYADQLKSNILEKNDTVEDTCKDEDLQKSDSEDDIADELSREINGYQNEKPSKKRFQVVESGAKNLLFIRTTITNPVEIVTSVINDILSSKEQKTRFLLRLLPIESTCKANMEDIKKNVSILTEKYFSGEPKSFAIAFNRRNNQQINRDEIIKEIADIVSIKNIKCKVDLKNADLTIIVEVIRGMCLLSIVPNYTKYKKYNLLQLYESVTQKPNTSHVSNEENIENTEEKTEKE